MIKIYTFLYILKYIFKITATSLRYKMNVFVAQLVEYSFWQTENQTDESRRNVLISRREDNTRNEEFSEELFLHFTEWEYERGCRSKLSNRERRWPGTDVSNILVFGPKRLRFSNVAENSIRRRTYFGGRKLAGVRAGMLKVLPTKAPTVSLDCTVSQFVIQGDT